MSIRLLNNKITEIITLLSNNSFVNKSVIKMLDLEIEFKEKLTVFGESGQEFIITLKDKTKIKGNYYYTRFNRKLIVNTEIEGVNI
jgi:uncharacterized protein (DUF1684 family)